MAVALEKAALADEYFVKRKLYPNVDFYSGVIYRCVTQSLNLLKNIIVITGVNFTFSS